VSRLRLAHAVTLGGILLLLGLLVLWYGMRHPAPIWLALFTLPLLLPLRGLIRGRAYTHAWTSFLIMIYFIHGVVEAWANPAARLLAAMEIGLSVSVYTGAILFARWAGQRGQR